MTDEERALIVQEVRGQFLESEWCRIQSDVVLAADVFVSSWRGLNEKTPLTDMAYESLFRAVEVMREYKVAGGVEGNDK